jgi:glycosyltransferase involved in cell wall biosynthesis
MHLSVIVPLYNEEKNVRPLYEAITNVLDPLSMEYEVLFVDDGSKDGTFRGAAELAHIDQRLRVIKFRKNYGQTAAMAAGIDNARGKILLTMDGDLQNDPVDIPRFLEKINQGYDIVVGWRYKRQDKLLTRRVPSIIANWAIGKVTGVPIKDNGCSLKAYRGDVIRKVPLYSEMHRFIPAMASLAGARIAETRVRHHPRRHGVSKYGLSRIYKVLIDLLTVKTIVSFSAQPLLWFSIMAIPPALISGVAIFVSLYRSTMQSGALPIPLAGTGVLFGALCIILLLGGMLAELVYRTGDTKVDDLARLTTTNLTLHTELDDIHPSDINAGNP